ncbi:MAG: RagB/SusD family nutrient uptake outer membrane protein [Prevotellaceae bacterium]|nr:RagB/SusD family nutrient uptake outer membrane protein [Prevotellaceae bacterium]
MKNKLYILLPLLAFFSFSCNEFLDVQPDNRTVLDTDEKITSLLTSAYADHLFLMTTEMMSDNYDDFGSAYLFTRLQEELFYWRDVTETGSNESVKNVWEGYYKAIAHANQSLQTIEEWGNPERLNPHRGEALMSRAYHHFILVNVFCKHYSTQTGHSDMGIPYAEEPETVVDPGYDRGTVAGVYAKIERDIEEALPLIEDNLHAVPKYHFNRKAAYAFATRFYLYCRKYDKVIEYAKEVLGDNPTGMLRNTQALYALTTDFSIIANEYIKPEHNANLLLVTGLSDMGLITGAWLNGKRFMHSAPILSEKEEVAPGPWGNTVPYMRRLSYINGSLIFATIGKLPYLFEYTDPVAGMGYRRTVLAAFTAEEVLLNRAEAYILMGDYDNAVADIQTWVRRHLKDATTPGRNAINTFYGGVNYYTSTAPTVKKALNPEVPVVSAEQENFLHCLLHIRRIEQLFDGTRWFDIKRYGIEITRRTVDANLVVREVDKLTVDDPRRAAQLPADVIIAGLPANPR